MITITDLIRAATIAQDAPFPTTLTMLPEGVEILVRQGDHQGVCIVGWHQLDGSELGLSHWVTDFLERLRLERDAAIAQAAGVRPFRPARHLP